MWETLWGVHRYGAWAWLLVGWIILEERQGRPQHTWKGWAESVGTAAADFREKLGLRVIKL